MTGSDRRLPAPAEARPRRSSRTQSIPGGTGDKVDFPDPAAAPLGTDDEAAGLPDTPDRVATALRREGTAHAGAAPAGIGRASEARGSTQRLRPLSPNIQIYRPQLTSVLSIANRISGLALSLASVGLVAWLIAAVSGPEAFSAIQRAISAWPGQVVLFGFTFAFFLHLCGGIRHLVWDTGHALDLRSIYLGGWTVVIASIVLTLADWLASFFLVG
jgi:succinate dehydrogenase cytochrome b subunit